jgi:hypothetical protein
VVIASGIIFINLVVLGWIAYWLKWLTSFGWIRNTLTITSVLACGVLIIGFYTQYVDQRYSRAVMIHSETVLREQPKAEAPPVTKAYEGYTFRVDHRQTRTGDDTTWMYARMSNGVYGWIPKSDILIL